MITVDGIDYITAAEAPAHLGADVTAEMVRAWGTRRMATRYRVGERTYYRLEELIEVEWVTRTAALGGRPRTRRRPGS